MRGTRKWTDAQIELAVQQWKTSDLVAAVAARTFAQATPVTRALFLVKWPGLGQLNASDFWPVVSAAAQELDYRFQRKKDDYDV